MYLKKIFLSMMIFFVLAACTNETQKDPTFEPDTNRDLELVKLSSEGVIDQNPSNHAKEILSNYEEVSGVRAVNDKEDILIGVDVDHHERFSLDNIENELRKKIRRNFSDFKITLSTDQKILLELEKLENDIQADNISRKKLKKEINHLKSLSKEET